MNEERLSALAMLSTENRMVENKLNFNDLVIHKFSQQKNRRMDFTLKHCV